MSKGKHAARATRRAAEQDKSQIDQLKDACREEKHRRVTAEREAARVAGLLEQVATLKQQIHLNTSEKVVTLTASLSRAKQTILDLDSRRTVTLKTVQGILRRHPHLELTASDYGKLAFGCGVDLGELISGTVPGRHSSKRRGVFDPVMHQPHGGGRDAVGVQFEQETNAAIRAEEKALETRLAEEAGR